MDSLLERRDRYIAEQRRKRKAVIRAATPVCCLCLAVMLGVGIWRSGLLERRPDTPIPRDTPGQNEYAVYTDSVELPENTSGEVFDMIGCLVYKGKVYTQSADANDIDRSAAAEKLVGEYVGEAKGTLDEWSTQEEWATEFASTYSGSVYKVNGYSEDFRLCIVSSGVERRLQFLDNYDGIGLNIGADLFEKRLHITGNVERVTYRTHSDWNEGISCDQDLVGITAEQFEQFLTELCKSPFERIDHENNTGFYDAETQGHLYLNMKNGTVIELRLIEGGYVGCQNLGWIFVKMPGELFDLVLSACQ